MDTGQTFIEFSDHSYQNNNEIVCQFCKSVMLIPGKAVLSKNHMYSLPRMFKKNYVKEFDNQDCRSFWIVNDIYTFENIGVTKVHNDIVYLCCADCEMGPVGYFNVNDSQQIFISCERTTYSIDIN